MIPGDPPSPVVWLPGLPSGGGAGLTAWEEAVVCTGAACWGDLFRSRPLGHRAFQSISVLQCSTQQVHPGKRGAEN